MRIMGYSGPLVTPNRRYFEVQIPITVAGESPADDDLRREFDLSDFLWKSRVLLAFAPSRANASYAALRRSWDSESGAVAERDLLLMEVFEQDENLAGETRLSSREAAKLREQFKVESGHSTFVLMGRDGTAKLRQPNVRLSALFNVIDGMPIRRAEMSRQRGR
jgi:hypothetical protein